MLVLVLGGCAHGGRITADRVVHGWVSTVDQRSLLSPIKVPLGTVTGAAATIEIDPGRRYQRMVGFGAAITDATAIVISAMEAGQRAALMKELFGRSPGLGISFVRLTIGASDFSPRHYSLDDMPPGVTDPALAHFSIAPIRETVVPVVREALALNPSLAVMASPWSAPGWMKTSDALVHGTLRPEAYGAFAGYLVKYVEAMRAQGVPIFALTLQNEPHFDTKNYPGMVLDPAMRATLVGRYVGPALAGMRSGPQLLEWDHNWNRPQEPLAVLSDPVAASHISGVAWHCYEGKVGAQVPVHEAHPDKDAYLTECSGGGWESPDDPALLRMTRELIIGSTRGWARGVLLWNLALDETAGPHLGGCTNCRGVLTVDSRTAEVTRNPEYYVIAHASRFVHPGAQRIESGETGTGVADVAFLNPDGSLVLIATNPGSLEKALRVRCGGREFQASLPAQSVATFEWRQPGVGVP